MAIYGDGKHDGGTIATLPTKTTRKIEGVTHTVEKTFDWQGKEKIEGQHPLGTVYVDGKRGYVQSGYKWLSFMLSSLPKMNQTAVIFRKFKMNGDIIAILPYTKGSTGYCSSYMYTGQHGIADGIGLVRITNPATPEEYASLKSELESIGYVLDVKKRINHRKYAEANK